MAELTAVERRRAETRWDIRATTSVAVPRRRSPCTWTWNSAATVGQAPSRTSRQEPGRLRGWSSPSTAPLNISRYLHTSHTHVHTTGNRCDLFAHNNTRLSIYCCSSFCQPLCGPGTSISWLCVSVYSGDNFRTNDLWFIYLARWIRFISRSSPTVKVTGDSSRSQEENVAKVHGRWDLEWGLFYNTILSVIRYDAVWWKTGRASGLHVKPCFSNLNASFCNNLLRNLAITNVKITYYLLISMDLLHIWLHRYVPLIYFTTLILLSMHMFKHRSPVCGSNRPSYHTI